VFFVTSSLITRWRIAEKEKKTEGALPRTGERNATQVFANGGVFVLLALVFHHVRDQRIAIAALGALAAATSDTWATEVGTLFGGAPRMITTWATVEPGLSGGVSAVGIVAALAGAAGIALCGALVVPDYGAHPAIAVAVGGFGGALTDSLIGATLQSRRFCDRCRHWTERRVHVCGYRTRHARGIEWMSNDTVNLACTSAGAFIAALAAVGMAHFGSGT
jgi:uncharacterized protein (TIGR00297 family)